MTPTVLFEEKDGLATITLNRPDRLNAIDLPTLELLIETLEQTAKNKNVRAVVLTGNGRAFCAGADQGEMVKRTPAEWEWIVDRYLDPIRIISRMDQPVVARLHGDTVGGGLGIALSCDYRIAAAGIRFCAPFVKLGLAGCDMAAGYFLPRLVGLSRATEMMMSARWVAADEAERMGLVTKTVAADALDATVGEIARNLAAGPPVALSMTKRAIRRSLDRPMEGEFDFEIFAQVQCLQSEDHREGLMAFREKRPPRFVGK